MVANLDSQDTPSRQVVHAPPEVKRYRRRDLRFIPSRAHCALRNPKAGSLRISPPAPLPASFKIW
jgi:hypothetical protein